MRLIKSAVVVMPVSIPRRPADTIRRL
jgi:hypothetical protein